jgi:hypothetical protein
MAGRLRNRRKDPIIILFLYENPSFNLWLAI